MSGRPPPRKRVSTHRRLALEALERREVFSLAPSHAVLPVTAVEGAHLLPDGSVAVYGQPQKDTTSETTINFGHDEQGNPFIGGVPATPPTEWTIGPDGRTISKTPIDPNGNAPAKNLYAVSPDGLWLAGTRPQMVVNQSGQPVLWHPGSGESVNIALPSDRTGIVVILAVSNSGDVIYELYDNSGSFFYAWDHAKGLLPVQSLYAIEQNSAADASWFTLQAMSADGTMIVGASGSGIGNGGLPFRATVWIGGVAHELDHNGYLSSLATSISSDGRIVGGYVGNSGGVTPAVWVDGQLHVLKDASGKLASGMVEQVVHGPSGEADDWAAVGGTNSGLWLARSDGVVQPLNTLLPQQYGLSLSGDERAVQLLENDQALYLVTFEHWLYPIVDCVDCNQQWGGERFAGHVLILPNDVVVGSDANRLDVSGDQIVAPLDVLLLINALNSAEGKTLFERPELRHAFPNIDIDGDGELTPTDALEIINFLNTAHNHPATGAANIALPLSQLGMSSAARLANGNFRVSQFGATVYDFDPQGSAAGQITVPLAAGQTFAQITAVSPNGRWLAGSQGSVDYSAAGNIIPGPTGLWDTQNSLAFHAIDLSGLPSVSGILQVSDSGVALIGVSGIFTYRWDEAHGLTKLTSLADLTGGTLTGVPGAHGWGISADGSVIVGDSGDSNGPHYATRWTDPTKPERLTDLGGVSEAWSISPDGHIIGGTVFDPKQNVNSGGRPLAAVWIDGQLNILHDAQGNQLEGGVKRVVNGIDGDPNKWVAIGWMSSGSFIAFSGGQVQPLADWLNQNYSIHLVDDQVIVGTFVDGKRLSLVTYDHRILPKLPCNVGDQELDCTHLPPLPPEANRLITVALRDSDFAAASS